MSNDKHEIGRFMGPAFDDFEFIVVQALHDVNNAPQAFDPLHVLAQKTRESRPWLVTFEGVAKTLTKDGKQEIENEVDMMDEAKITIDFARGGMTTVTIQIRMEEAPNLYERYRFVAPTSKGGK